MTWQGLVIRDARGDLLVTGRPFTIATRTQSGATGDPAANTAYIELSVGGFDGCDVVSAPSTGHRPSDDNPDSLSQGNRKKTLITVLSITRISKIHSP